MKEKKNNKEKKKSERSKELENLKQKSPSIVFARSDDLAEVVTETVTKLLAEDVLEMDDSGKIDVKKPDNLKAKDKKQKEKKDNKKK